MDMPFAMQTIVVKATECYACILSFYRFCAHINILLMIFGEQNYCCVNSNDIEVLRHPHPR